MAFRCGYYVVWCTKYRLPVLDQAVQRRLRQLACEVIEDKGAWLHRITVRPSQVDLVVEVSPQLGVHRLVKTVKTRTAGSLRSEFPTLRSRIPSLWTNAYFVSTLGVATPEGIQQFIEQQPKR